MRTPVESLSNTVQYHRSDRDEPVEHVPDSGVVDAVEVSFYCPYCDCPNHAIDTAPILENELEVCDHCGERVSITPLTGSEYSRERVHPEQVRDAVNRLERAREARVEAERTPGSVRSRARLLDRLSLVIGCGGLVAGVFVMLVGLGVGAASVGMLGMMLMLATTATTLHVKEEKHRLAARGTSVDGQMLDEYPATARRGFAVADGDAELYVPPEREAEEQEETITR